MKHSRKTFINRDSQTELIQLRVKERAYIEGEIPKTGRSLKNYSIQLGIVVSYLFSRGHFVSV